MSKMGTVWKLLDFIQENSYGDITSVRPQGTSFIHGKHKQAM